MMLQSLLIFPIVTDIQCDILSRTKAFSRLPMAQMMHFDLLL